MENTVERKFRHLDLFSGIGGFALAASWVWGDQHEVVSFCEQNKFCQKLLSQHWPGIPIHTDIKRFNQQNEISKHKGYDYGRIDLLTGGFPCQPYSVAGKQDGAKDDRALWPEMFRVIKEAKPNWIIGENVAGFIGMGLDDSLSDLESQGYETTSFIIPACGTGANHKRERIWIVANSKGIGSQRCRVCKNCRGNSKKSRISDESSGAMLDDVTNSAVWRRDDVQIERSAEYKRSSRTAGRHYCSASDTKRKRSMSGKASSCCKELKDNKNRKRQERREQPRPFCNRGLDANTDSTRQQELDTTAQPGWSGYGSRQNGRRWNGWSLSESPVCRATDGISNRVDRIKGLGNAIVPQVVVPIFEAIKQIDDGNGFTCTQKS